MGKKTSGAHPSTYDIVYDIKNIKTILEEYPSLLPDLQKNNKVIELILDEHKWITDAYCHTKKLDIANLPENLKDDPVVASLLNLVDMKKPFHDDLKEKLQTSASFFRLFVNNSSEAMKNRAIIIIYIALKSQPLEPKSNIIINSVLDTIYETCVLSDMLNGDDKCDKGIIYIIENNKSKWEDEGG